MNNTMMDRTKDVIDTATDKAKSATDFVAEKSEKVAHTAAEHAGEIGERARLAADRAQRWAGEVYDSTAHAARDMSHELTSLIRRYPIPALLVGFGMGVVMGRVVRA
jgi:ElaB/YqjD/DUF883 family membrane-anchored ribosome-binding protein